MQVLKPIRGIQLNSTHPLARNLAGAWLFNEGTGDAVFDLTENGNNGTFINGPVWTGGEHGWVLACDGANDYLILDEPSTITNKFKLSIWFSTITSASTCVFGTVDDGSSGIFALYLNLQANGSSDANSVRLQVRDDSAGYRTISFNNATLYDGHLHCVTCTRDGSTTKMYLDGVEQPLTVDADTLGTSDIVLQYPFAFGARNSRGVIDLNSDINISHVYFDENINNIAQLNFNPYAMFEPAISPALLYTAGGIAHPIFGNNIHSAIFGGQVVR